MRQVTHKDFHEFIKNYPNPLEIDINQAGDPPQKSYNDFTLGDWPESVVASCCMFPDIPYYTDIQKDYIKCGEYLENKWRINYDKYHQLLEYGKDA